MTSQLLVGRARAGFVVDPVPVSPPQLQQLVRGACQVCSGLATAIELGICRPGFSGTGIASRGAFIGIVVSEKPEGDLLRGMRASQKCSSDGRNGVAGKSRLPRSFQQSTDFSRHWLYGVAVPLQRLFLQ